MLRSLQQERANYAWNCIKKVKQLNNEKKEEYNSYVKKSPALIQNNGLGNTLAFYKAKKSETYDLLYKHLNEWFKQKFKQDSQDILEWIISEDTSSIEVFQETKEILALLNWMKRFAEAELKKEE